MSPALRWILAIVGLLAANVTAMVILAVTSHVDKPEIIPHYYQRAAHYDDQIDQAAENHALAWTTKASIERDAIDVEVRDEAGAPLDGAQVRVAGYQRIHANQPYDVELHALGHGRYRISRAARAGMHDIVVTVVLGASRFVARRVVDVK